MDKPIHLDASILERTQRYDDALRNSLRRYPAIIRIGEASDVENILAVKAADVSTPTRIAGEE